VELAGGPSGREPLGVPEGNRVDGQAAQMNAEAAVRPAWEDVREQAFEAMLAPLSRAADLPDADLAAFAVSGGRFSALKPAIDRLVERAQVPGLDTGQVLARAQANCGLLAARQREFQIAQLMAVRAKLAAGDYRLRPTGAQADAPEAPRSKFVGLSFYAGSDWYAECSLSAADILGYDEYVAAIDQALTEFKSLVLW
jgi:hypothetical protein